MSNKSTSKSLKGLSKTKIILFKGISIVLIPLLILFFAEMLLRVFSYGDNLNLFIDYKGDSNYWVLNPDASKKYFTEQEIATRGNAEIFKKKKGDSTIRIFVLGESTTIGYPYFHNGSFHRWLQYRLAHTYPDKSFEIINLSLTAVNSYTVLGFAKEVMNYQPDAVLIYTGHNEYYGALGAASTQSLGSNPRVINFILSLRDLRLAQLVINIYDHFKQDATPPQSKQGESRMELMVAQQEIPLHSDLYEKGVAQFRDNMDAIMKLLNDRHIPLFVSNLISNEKDLKPFISFSPAVKSVPFENAMKESAAAFAKKDFNTAEISLKKANSLYGLSALCNYMLGQVACQKGDFATAKKYLIKAKDLDGLRFRAPERFNDVITELCSKYPEAHLIDTKAAFEASAEHHIVDDELTVDHVHPDLKGYAILSDAFYQALKKYGVVPKPGNNEMDFDHLVKNMPANKIDSTAGVYRILNLKKKWPYNDAHATDGIRIQTEEDTLAYKLVFENIKWANIMDDAYNYYVGNHQLIKARSILENLSLEYPADADLYQRIAMISGELNDTENIIYNLKKSFNLAPSFEKASYLFVNYLKIDQPENAIPYITYATNNNASGLDLTSLKNNTEQLIQLQKQYLGDTTNATVLLKITKAYAVMGNDAGTAKYLNKTLVADPGNKEALSIMARSTNKPSR